MKTNIFNKLSLILILLFIFSMSVFGQISTNETPYSLLAKEDTRQQNTIKLKSPNMQQITKEDAINDRNGGLERISVPISVSFNMEKNGEWRRLSNGNSLWSLSLSVVGAKSLDFVFDKFWLPEEGKFFIYNPNTGESIGAITSQFLKGNRNKPDDFSTGIILGDKMILEYYQPKYVKEKPIISISTVYYGYRYVEEYKNKAFGNSQGCEININCNEGQAWQKEKEAVARIYVKTPTGGGWCSGSLINNTSNNLEPLFLTANHCFDKYFDALGNTNLSQWIFYWHYEHPNCNNSSLEPTKYSTLGAEIKANNENSDFALLRLKQDPRELSNFTPYYLGWDRTDNSGVGAVGIHHPSGDVKKISIEYNTPNKVTFSAGYGWYNAYCWRVIWDKGTTEGGSSGSPLFNSNHKVIGQLYGGNASCSNTTGHDNYGRFDISWTGDNNSDIRRRLDHWLDPNGTGTTVLEGKSCYEILGSNTICNQKTYTIDLPAGITVHWSTSNNKLQLLSGQGTGTAIFKKNGNGKCEIKAKLVGLDIELIKRVNVGTPVNIPFIVNSLSGSNALCKDIPNELIVNLSTTEEQFQEISEYEWKVSDPNWQLLEHIAGSGNPIHGKNFVMLLQGTPNSSSSVYISVRARNSCGWGEWSVSRHFTAQNCQGYGYFQYFLSPNGDGINDTWEITATKKSGSLKTENKYQKVPVYNVTIFNSKGNIVYQKDNYMRDRELFYGVGNIGKYKGSTLADGDYFFTITGSIAASGHIYIKRK